MGATDMSVPRGTSWPEEVFPKEVLFQNVSNNNLILANSQIHGCKGSFC